MMRKMIHQYTTSEAKKRLKDLIEAALRGETIQIIKDDQAGVELVPFERAEARKFGIAKGKLTIADDFNAPIDDFEAPLKQAW